MTRALKHARMNEQRGKHKMYVLKSHADMEEKK